MPCNVYTWPNGIRCVLMKAAQLPTKPGRFFLCSLLFSHSVSLSAFCYFLKWFNRLYSSDIGEWQNWTSGLMKKTNWKHSARLSLQNGAIINNCLAGWAWMEGTIEALPIGVFIIISFCIVCWFIMLIYFLIYWFFIFFLFRIIFHCAGACSEELCRL